MGSLYVWPGCTFHGYKDNDYWGGYQAWNGPYEGYMIEPEPMQGINDCPNGYTFYILLFEQAIAQSIAV